MKCPYCGSKSEKLGSFMGCLKVESHIFRKDGKPLQTTTYSKYRKEFK